MDTSLSDIIEACGTITTYDAECVGSSVSQSILLFAKKLTN